MADIILRIGLILTLLTCIIYAQQCSCIDQKPSDLLRPTCSKCVVDCTHGSLTGAIKLSAFIPTGYSWLGVTVKSASSNTGRKHFTTNEPSVSIQPGSVKFVAGGSSGSTIQYVLPMLEGNTTADQASTSVYYTLHITTVLSDRTTYSSMFTVGSKCARAAPTAEPTLAATEQPTAATPAASTDAPAEAPSEAPSEAPQQVAPEPEAPTEATEAPTEEEPKVADEPAELPTEEPLKPPTGAPEHPTEAPEHPTEAPEHPTEAPEHPTEAPEEPTEAPVEPTEAPEEPTAAPEEPTEAPEEPTEAPEEPTEAPEDSDVEEVDTVVGADPEELTPDAPTEEPTEAPTEAPEEPTEEPTEPATPAPMIPPTTSSEEPEPTPVPAPTARPKVASDGRIEAHAIFYNDTAVHAASPINSDASTKFSAADNAMPKEELPEMLAKAVAILTFEIGCMLYFMGSHFFGIRKGMQKLLKHKNGAEAECKYQH